MPNAPTARSGSYSLSLSASKSQSQETLKAFENNKHKLFENFRAELESDPKDLQTTQNKSTKSPKQPSLFPLDEDKGLNNAGDFRSKDCIELLKLADIVVTNPPFSLFREYVAQLVEYKKKFLIIGNIHAITYKEIFPYLKNNQIWIGYTKPKEFIDAKNKTTQKFGNIYWYSNLSIKKLNEILETIASYTKTPEKYPKYDNYDAIDVQSVMEIPLDYNGVMGVPSAFLDKYNPKQFQLLGIGTGKIAKELGVTKNYRGRTDLSINSKCPYARILIRKIAEVNELRKQEQEKM
ncbi:adenine-specific methyltransferase EcoRI family protein [Helicobacter canis]|nr:adenine-specific methyltransferase EcoRI family protein [Helicobacter canis]